MAIAVTLIASMAIAAVLMMVLLVRWMSAC